MERNTIFLSKSVTDEIICENIGNQIITGMEKSASKLDTMKKNRVSALQIHKILTHGKEGAVNGTTKMQSGKMEDFLTSNNSVAQKEHK
ncbi:hypothetical protein ACVWYG_001487 [Pedobacter sp. UYEF25]